MPGICFYTQPGVGPPDDPVQDAHTFVVVISASKAPSHLHFELALNAVLEIIKVLVTTEHGELVTMDDDFEVTRHVGETAW